jgi:hypothetical protein
MFGRLNFIVLRATGSFSQARSISIPSCSSPRSKPMQPEKKLRAFKGGLEAGLTDWLEVSDITIYSRSNFI